MPPPSDGIRAIRPEPSGNGHRPAAQLRPAARVRALAPVGGPPAGSTAETPPTTGAVPPPAPGSGRPADDRPAAFAAVVIDRDDDLAAVFGSIDAAGSPRVALAAPRGNHELAGQLGMRRLQRHLDLTGKDLILVTRSRVLRVRAREEGVPAVTSLRRVDFDHPHGRDLHLGWVTLRLPTLGALLAVVLFAATVIAGAVVLFWYVPTATVTVYLPAQPLTQTIDIIVDSKAAEVDVTKGIVPAHRREITVQRSLPGPATGVSFTPVDHAAVGLVFTNKTARAVTVPKGTVVTSTSGMPFTVANDVNLAPRVGATGEAIALAQRPGIAGNVLANTATGLDGALAQQVSVTNPLPGEKGTDLQQTVVSDNDVNLVKELAKNYLGDAAKKQLLAQYANSETVFGDSVQVQLGDCTPVPPVGQTARYVEVTCSAKVSMLMAADQDLRQIWTNRFRADLPADRMLLDDTFKATNERSGPPDLTFDRLPVTQRVTVMSAPYVDRAKLRQKLAGKNRTGVERAVRELVAIDVPPLVELPSWAPWLPRRAHHIHLVLKPAPE